ncbi:tetratricopeptide repeat protein [Myxococcus sp. RHSTA-1-4]|uniref:tetratricopeptide repeat protein n=1 Tax=Myxococcus sp. RHSTA-1-4 TaxID=2874601 RepID=UPI001CBAD09A|nr:tetratricopeptide repeat protein [Myxococcus sp. RHSTA-1-4]MBZ4417766.1 AIM24 family protein [Myxococcus sp. RHSTA-1-4]
MTTRAKGRGEKSPADDEFLQQLYRGGELLAAGKVKEAREFLERAHQLQPRQEKAQNLLGLCYFKLGMFDRAAELYEMLVRDNPVDPTLRVNLGLVYLKTNALQRAAREFETATDLAPEHQKAQNYLGLTLAQMGEYGRAREHFLLAGSDAMAEKMSRAIAGEGFSRPTPAQPARARGFAELDDSDEAREQAGELVAAPATPPAPAKAAEPARPQARSAGLAEGDWGAQFGLDTGRPAAAAAPARAEPEPEEEEIRLAEDEGPSALSAGGEEMPVLTATPEDAEELAMEAQHEPPAGPSPDSAFEETSAALASSVPLTPVPLSRAQLAKAKALARAGAAAPAPSDAAAGVTAPAAPEGGPGAAAPAVPEGGPAIAAPPSPAAAPEGAAWALGTTVPTLSSLAPAVALSGADAAHPFLLGHGSFSVVVDGELLTRLEGMVAFSGSLTFQPEMKRFRGRATDKAFGEGAARMVRAKGRGILYMEPSEKRTFLAVDLGEDSAYFRDECVFAFEEPVMFENGRVPSDIAPDLDLVHLRGQGRVLLSLPGTLRSVPVHPEQAVTVPLTHLVGWQGNLTPRVVPLLKSPTGEVLRTAVELGGEGFALIALGVR